VANLEKSYANFPNPFAAGREPTHFAYYLPSSGQVTLRIWTARGERVATVLEGASRAQGLHQDDAWDGRNGHGDVVTNGVYLAEIVVKLADGESRRLLRKVAVVR
jgi:flagellar hook assembly protein FlgD